MRRFFSIALALCVSLTLSLDVNAARRLGGGKSFGSAPTHQTRQAQPTQQAPSATNAPMAGRQPAAASGASRWLGPLAGIAAGGLLASLFMGDGFQGMQILDFLLIGLAAFLLLRFLAARKRMQQGQPAMAGHAPFQREMPQQQTPIFGNAAPAVAQPAFNAPSWFNEQRFIEAGREHFMTLQQHWDASEMDKIAEFFTSQMLNFLKEERASLGDTYQSTYIDNLHVQLDGIDELADKTVATLTFNGISKTSRFDQGEAFSESWRMERMHGDDKPWLVAGIRQN